MSFLERPKQLPRSAYAFLLLTLLNALLFSSAHAEKKDLIFYAWIPILVITVVSWPIFTMARLRAIGWSRWWTIAIAIPWAALAWAARSRMLSAYLVAFAIIFVVHLPLLLVPGQEEPPKPTNVRPSAE
jgi:uncharacterized membrane protein YhaH (DUF805 family)